MISYPRPHFQQQKREVEQRYRILDGSTHYDTNYLARTVALAFGVPMVVVALNERYRGWLSSRHGIPKPLEEAVASLCSFANLSEHVFQVEDARGDPYFAAEAAVSADGGVVFFAGSPLVSPEGLRFGTLCLLDPRARRLDDRQIRLLDSFGHLISQEICVRSAARYAVRDLIDMEEDRCNLYDLAMTDPLTGALNRRAFQHFGEREVRRAVRRPRELSAVMFDIDRFKVVNDTHGHAVGDEVIKRLAGVVAANIREEDYFGRLGGEEFCLLLPETHPVLAMRLANRIRMAAKSEVFPSDSGLFSVTVSLGISGILPGEKALGTLMDRADRALYAAKNAGRDCAKLDLGVAKDDAGVNTDTPSDATDDTAATVQLAS